ncbi:MAG: fructose-1,6-bisphosphatase class 1 2 [Chloroflexota bacterium]
MPSSHLQTLDAFLDGRVPAGVAAIVRAFAGASAELRDALATAPLRDLLGATGETNVQEEATAKLDQYANDLFHRSLAIPGVVQLISEEDALPVVLGSGDYTVCFDPLDGSSNIGVAPVGSVIGIYTGFPAGPFDGATAVTGRQMGVAGFVVYGLPTVMVLATGSQVDGFAFDPEDRTWRLAFPGIRAQRAKYSSINWMYRDRWSPSVVRAVDAASQGLRGRYSGSMVEDVLRVLMSGGVFLYPEDSASPGGKLRMLYEICPIGLIMESAGGAAIDGSRPVLDVPVTDPHQRGPLVAGAADAVERYRLAYSTPD